jgi:putative tryptophan/tyrosine transport system substrate-binding protein
MIRRRDFITLLSSGAVAWPLDARAQQQAMPVIGFLNSASADLFAHLVRAFHGGLNESGYVEGNNIAIEYRWADGNYDRLPGLAADLVRRQVNVIAASGGSVAALTAKAATTTIPIVFQLGTDPVQAGLVTSLNRPGRNLTGVTTLTAELDAKRLELLHEMAPTVKTVAILLNPTSQTSATPSQELRGAARVIGIEIVVVRASSENHFDAAFEAIAQARAGALFISPDPFLNSRSTQLAALALRQALRQSSMFVNSPLLAV